MTTARNPSASTPYPYLPLALPVTTDQTINEGDMVWWDSVNGTLKPLTAQSQVQLVAGSGGFVGVAAVSNKPIIYPDPIGASAGQDYNARIAVYRLGAVFMKTTPGEFYGTGTPVSVGADAQTITLTQSGVAVDSTHRVGWTFVPLPASPQGAAGSTPLNETLAGGTGVYVQVLLESKWPATTVV